MEHGPGSIVSMNEILILGSGVRPKVILECWRLSESAIFMEPARLSALGTSVSPTTLASGAGFKLPKRVPFRLIRA